MRWTPPSRTDKTQNAKPAATRLNRLPTPNVAHTNKTNANTSSISVSMVFLVVVVVELVLVQCSGDGCSKASTEIL